MSSLSVKELHLSLASICESQLNPVTVSHGITIKSMESLQDDPNRNWKLYELVSEIRRDIPTNMPIDTVPFDEFVAGFLLMPSRLPDATLVAVNNSDDEYVAFSDLFNNGNRGLLAGLTGVRREYRNRGIAIALKQCGFRYAIAHGFNGITTFIVAHNAAIAAVNKRLGFIEKFTWLHFEKHVSNG